MRGGEIVTLVVVIILVPIVLELLGVINVF
jgi:hypothetical protein